MTEIKDAPVEAAARTAAPRDEGEDQPCRRRGATSALLRKVLRRTSAEVPHDSEGAAAAIPENSWNGPGLVRALVRLTRTAAKRLTACG